MSGTHKAWKAALFSKFPLSQFGYVHSQRCSSCPFCGPVDGSLDVISHSEGWLCGDWPPVQFAVASARPIHRQQSIPL